MTGHETSDRPRACTLGPDRAGRAAEQLTTALPRVSERRRAAVLARHYREAEGLSVKQIAERMGRTPATIRAYLYDPDGAKSRKRTARYRGVCEACGTSTSGAGPGRPRPLCARCNGRRTTKWEKHRIEAALRAWQERYGAPAKTTDLSVSYATAQAPRDGGVRLRRLEEEWDGGRWPASSVVQYHYGTVAEANRVAFRASPSQPTDGGEGTGGESHAHVPPGVLLGSAPSRQGGAADA